MIYFGIDITKLLSLFVYNPDDPLLFVSGFFLFLFLFLLLFKQLGNSNVKYRIGLLIAISFFFYYKASGYYFILLLLSSALNFYITRIISRDTSVMRRRFLFFLGILINLLPLFYFKYTNFFIQILNNFNNGQLQPMDIFLPAGISFFTFKAMSYLIDVYNEMMEPVGQLSDFILFVSFFPNILAGPIDRASEFLPQIRKEVFLSRADLGYAIYLIMAGLFKKVIIADYISLNFVDRVFDWPTRYSGVENLLAVYGYTLQIYCDFSGYSDMAIGIALLLGFKLRENFNSPYQANSVAEFWRRWHMSLSSWLLDYVFKPLQMKWRNMRLAGNALAVVVTFLLCGLWHGANWNFVIWGTLHGIFIAFSMLIKSPKDFIYTKLRIKNSRILKAVQVFITFNLIAFTWVFFRAANFQLAYELFNQIFSFFHAEIFMQFYEGYPMIIYLIVLGYVLHFIPRSLENKFSNLIGRLPIVGKALLLVAVIYLVIQVRSADMQPFLYFQF